MKGIAASVPLATILSDPVLRRAVAAGLETVTIETGDGRKVSGALAVPAQTPAPGVVLVHEWWGLNDQIKSVAAELANNGYLTIAVDLFEGHVAATADEAAAQSRAVGADPAAARATLVAWIDWLKKNLRCDGHLATWGYCFGGGWALNGALAAPVDATVIFYGNVRKTAAELASLKGPVLMHYGLLDRNINTEMVEGFETEAKKAGKPVTVYAYEGANHAFANPTGAAYPYVKEAAELAWKRSIAFLKKYDT
jgi:carboxymethylenebutenolidase